MQTSNLPFSKQLEGKPWLNPKIDLGEYEICLQIYGPQLVPLYWTICCRIWAPEKSTLRKSFLPRSCLAMSKTSAPGSVLVADRPLQWPSSQRLKLVNTLEAYPRYAEAYRLGKIKHLTGRCFPETFHQGIDSMPTVGGSQETYNPNLVHVQDGFMVSSLIKLLYADV